LPVLLYTPLNCHPERRRRFAARVEGPAVAFALALAVACSFVCHPAGICFGRCRCLFSLNSTQNPGCPILSPPDRAMVGESIPYPHLCRCFSPLLLLLPSSPFLFSPLLFSARPLRPSALSASVVALAHESPVFTPQSPHPQTIFPAFTQQNRMSSPQTPPKTNNPNPINKIKVSQKRFLVMVNQVQLN
jgi:hypothetical protein